MLMMMSIPTVVQTLSVYLLAICIVQQQLLNGAAMARRIHKRFIIHVPIRIKTHHHTHTVYSQVQSSGGTKQTIYKILGYAAHDNNYGHGHAQGYGHGHAHGHGYKHDDTLYEDFHGGGGACDAHHPHGDMVFNHYARNSHVAYEDVVDGVDAAGEEDAENGDYDYPDADEYVNKQLGGSEWT